MKEKAKVLKHYPNARLMIRDDGSYVIENDEVVLAEEYLLPDAFDEPTAWKYAALACKTTQNFNRTHPDRLDLSDIESKLSRIQIRKRNAKKNKRTV